MDFSDYLQCFYSLDASYCCKSLVAFVLLVYCHILRYVHVMS